MNLLDIASIVFICTAANHLGLIPAVEKTIRRSIPPLNCPKCLTFWSVLAYGIAMMLSGNPCGIITVLAISFLAAWSAIWIDLLMGIVDRLYLKAYDTLYPTTDPADTDALGTDDPVHGLPCTGD